MPDIVRDLLDFTKDTYTVSFCRVFISNVVKMLLQSRNEKKAFEIVMQYVEKYKKSNIKDDLINSLWLFSNPLDLKTVDSRSRYGELCIPVSYLKSESVFA